MDDPRVSTPRCLGGAICLGLALFALAGCSPRTGAAVVARRAPSPPAAPADTASFATRLAAFMVQDAAVREQARQGVAADREAWQRFEDIAAAREDRRTVHWKSSGLPADRRKLGYGLVEARSHLGAVVAADPSAAEAWARLAHYSLEIGDPARGLTQARWAVAATDARARACEPVADGVRLAIRQDLAWALHDLADWDEGLAAADEGLAEFPGDRDLTVIKGLLLAGAGRLPEAIAVAAQLPPARITVIRGLQGKTTRKVPSDYESQWIRARAYAARGDYAMAFHLLGQDPSDLDRSTNLGGGTQDRKLGTMSRMPHQVRFLNDVGLIAEMLGAKAAIDYYTRAWDQREFAYYYPSGVSASGPLVQGVPDERMPYFESFFGRYWVAGSRFAFVAAQMNRVAMAAGEAARCEAAAAAFLHLDILERRGVRADVVHALRGRLHYRLEQWEAARHHLAQAHASFAAAGQVDPRTSLLLGMLALREERFRAAAAWYREALAADPSQALGWRMLGVACANLELGDEAIAAMDQAVALEPASLAGRYNRGLLLLQLRRCREAVMDLDVALRLDPDNADLPRLLQLAATCGRSGETVPVGIRAEGVGEVLFEADLDMLVRQLAGDLAAFFTPADSVRPVLADRLELLDQAAAAGGGTALRGARAILLSDLGRPAAARDLLAGAWPDGLRPPEDLVLLYSDWQLGEPERLHAVVRQALTGELHSSDPYLWALAVLEIRRDPRPWGDGAEARVVARWFDRPDNVSGTTIRYWSEVIAREFAVARGGWVPGAIDPGAASMLR